MYHLSECRSFIAVILIGLTVATMACSGIWPKSSHKARATEVTTQAKSKNPLSTKSKALAFSLAEEVCVGESHSCVRTNIGRVACWGDNDGYQVAHTDEPQIESPRWIRELPTSVTLRCGLKETCVITRSEEIYCFGSSRWVEKLALPGPATDLVLAGRGGCAILDDGKTLCWETEPRYKYNPTASAVVTINAREPRPIPEIKGAKRFARTSAFATVACVKSSSAFQCINMVDQNTPFIDLPDDASELATADTIIMPDDYGKSFCGLWRDRPVRCFGEVVSALNRDRKLVTEGTASSVVAIDIGGFCIRDASQVLRCEGEKRELIQTIPKTMTMVATGYNHACGVDNGAVRCWGAASYGQLGNATPYIHKHPELVPDLTDAISIDASVTEVCVVRRNGAISCWGSAPISTGSDSNYFTPVNISIPEPAFEVHADGPGQVATSREGRRDPLRIRGASGWWYYDFRWRRGVPVVNSSLQKWPANYHALSRDLRCAIDNSDRLICSSGLARPGQRTISTERLVFSPNTRFSEATSVFEIDGREYVCGRTNAGKVDCFLVDKEAVNQSIVSSLNSLTNIVQVQAARFGRDSVACALDATGALYCWGSNRWGQLGDSTHSDAFEAVAIKDLPPITQLAVGATFVCALTSQGQVYCWGSNRHGTAPNGHLGVRLEAVPLTLPQP